MEAIISRVYLGGIVDATALKSSNPRDIKTVITCCDINPRLGEEYNHIMLPFGDGEPVPPVTLDRCLSAIWDGVREGNVLVHCAAGISRSPCIVAAYLHRCGFLEFDDALAYIQKIRTRVVPNNTIVCSIKEAMGIFPYGVFTDSMFKDKTNERIN